MININKEQREKLIEIVNALEELDDVQNIFTNANLETWFYENSRNRPRIKRSHSHFGE